MPKGDAMMFSCGSRLLVLLLLLTWTVDERTRVILRIKMRPTRL